MWSKCPDWCFQDECEEGRHRCYQEFWHQLRGTYGRINRNYNTGVVEVDLGRDSHDYAVSLRTREELEEVLLHIKELSAFLAVAHAEVERALAG